jgi:hypothetical protein
MHDDDAMWRPIVIRSVAHRLNAMTQARNIFGMTLAKFGECRTQEAVARASATDATAFVLIAVPPVYVSV